MSRRPKSEQEFGSDSFLDVVANIVGILIILIVIAGLRVSQAPVITFEATDAEPPAPNDFADAPLEPLLLLDDDEAPDSPAPRFVSDAPRIDPNEPALLEPPDLTDVIGRLTDETQRLETDLSATATRTSELRQQGTGLKDRQAELARRFDAAAKKQRLLLDEDERRRTSFDQLQTTAAELLKQIEAEEEKSPPVEKIPHRVTPLGKEVTGFEQHYRLAGNRVSEVPIAALSVRLKSQIERRKDWLIKQQSSSGEVGPLGGYVMTYKIQREGLGVLDEVRFGQGMVRLSVSQWRIEPTPELNAESADTALKPGSQFYDSLLAADEGTTLTFWVYPDSYELYRKLQKFAHEQGFLVAGRPLPYGIPISGSPSGMKSSGQ